MKWNLKEISKLTDDELIDAIRSVGDMDKNRMDKLENKKKRHKDIEFKENPVFTELANELNSEFKNRKLTNA